MFAVLKIVHLLSLGMVALALSNAYLGPLAGRSESAARNALLPVIVLFGRIGRTGLLLLWVSGITMLWLRYGGNPLLMPATFLWKLGFVVLATIGVIVIDYTPLRHRPAVVGMGGLAADTAIVLAVVFAVLTFN